MTVCYFLSTSLDVLLRNCAMGRYTLNMFDIILLVAHVCCVLVVVAGSATQPCRVGCSLPKGKEKANI